MSARGVLEQLRPLSDEDLARQVDRDFEAFAELYRRHLCRIYRFMHSRTLEQMVAEDLTARVFFKALSSAGTFKAEGTYQAWLFQIAYTTLVSWRTHKERLAVGMEELPEKPDPLACPATQAIQSDTRSTIWETVGELPPAQREVVRLRYLHDFTTEEISRKTKRSRGAVRVLLHRARLKLRRALEGVEF